MPAMTPTARSGRTGTLVALCGLVLAALALMAGPASAAPVAPDNGSGEGWVRLAHFSPDTPAVDVALTAFSDSRSMLALSDVAYGDISAYRRVPAGTYSASMLPAGAAPGARPVITQAVTVESGRAYTVAAVGRNADLTGTVLTDDLTPPDAGQARIRLVQASVTSPEVTVQAAGGPLIADAARFGTATGYAQIGPGVWTVQLTGAAGPPVTSTVTVQPGTVSTLTVLDRNGALGLESVVDSAGTATAPRGGVPTGGGGTATPGGDGAAALAAVLGALGVLGVLGGISGLARAGRR